MEESQEDLRASNHSFLLKFLNKTANFEDEIAECIKATIAQFLQGVRKDLTHRALEHEGMISDADIYQSQIKSIRRCIVDLERCLNISTLGRGLIQ